MLRWLTIIFLSGCLDLDTPDEDEEKDTGISDQNTNTSDDNSETESNTDTETETETVTETVTETETATGTTTDTETETGTDTETETETVTETVTETETETVTETETETVTETETGTGTATGTNTGDTGDTGDTGMSQQCTEADLIWTAEVQDSNGVAAISFPSSASLVAIGKASNPCNNDITLTTFSSCLVSHGMLMGNMSLGSFFSNNCLQAITTYTVPASSSIEESAILGPQMPDTYTLSLFFNDSNGNLASTSITVTP